MKPRIGIIGAGLSGLTLCNALSGIAQVTLFEKARGVGGRMSTRYADAFEFDHGAPYFTARSRTFKKFLTPFIERGEVAEWKPKVVTLALDRKPYKRLWYEPHYVACPRMNVLCKTLSHDVKLQLKTRINRLTKGSHTWVLTDDLGADHGPFEWVICTAPAPQTAELLRCNFSHQPTVNLIRMLGCHTLMLGFTQAINFNWQIAEVHDNPIRQIIVNSSKPGRTTQDSLVVQTDLSWSLANMDQDPRKLTELLINQLLKLTHLAENTIDYRQLHQWRYARIQARPTDDPTQDPAFYMDSAQRLAACGDWCLKGTVESAYLSAEALANQLKDQLSTSTSI